jgi:hypothetical protein
MHTPGRPSTTRHSSCHSCVTCGSWLTVEALAVCSGFRRIAADTGLYESCSSLKSPLPEPLGSEPQSLPASLSLPLNSTTSQPASSTWMLLTPRLARPSALQLKDEDAAQYRLHSTSACNGASRW